MEKEKNTMLKHISQVGILVKNMDKAVEGMKQVFGVEPDSWGQTPETKRKYKGKEAKFAAKMAFYRFANIEIELIEPLYGESSWKDYIDRGKEGIHHIRFSVDNFEKTVSSMKERGICMLQEGCSVKSEKLRWGLFDTEETLSFIVEIFNEFEEIKN